MVHCWQALFHTPGWLGVHAPAERDRAEAVACAAAVARADTPGVREALAMVATADFVFTPDTSILHAASAFRIPTVALVTGDHKVRWGLFGTEGEAVASCGDTLAGVPLAEVVEVVDRVVESIGSSSWSSGAGGRKASDGMV